MQYHRNERNVGGARNQAIAVERSRGRYVRLSAHDDKMAPTHLEECVAALEEHPDATIAFTSTLVIDEVGAVVSDYHSTRGTGATPALRFRELIFRNHNCDAIYGVIRGDVLRSVRPMENFIDGDKVFLCRIAFHGPFLSIDRPLFYKRFHPKNWVGNWRDRMAWYNPDRKGKVSFPNWLELRSFSQAVVTAPIACCRSGRAAAPRRCTGSCGTRPSSRKDVLVVAVQLRRAASSATPIYNWE